MLSNINKKAQLSERAFEQKVIDINTLLAVECRHHKIDLIDDINVTGIGKKGLHPNNLGKEQIAGNLLDYITQHI